MDKRTTARSSTTPRKLLKHAAMRMKRANSLSSDSVGIELRRTGIPCGDSVNGEYRVVRYHRRCGVVSIVNGEVSALVYDRNDAGNDLEGAHSRAMITCRQWISQHPEEVLAKAAAVCARDVAGGSEIGGE